MTDELSVTVSPAQIGVEPGGTAEVALQVQNRGAVVDEFLVDVLGDAAPWVSLSRTRVPIFPGQTESIQLSLKPPRAPRPLAGVVPVGFRVTSTVDPTQMAVEECRVEIKPFTEIGGEVVPRTARGRFSATHRVRVSNRGNAPVSVALRAEVQQGDCQVSISQSTMELAAGQRGASKVKVRPTYTRLRGAEEFHQYRFSLEPQGGAPITLDATMRQRPIAQIPTAILLAAALVLGGAYVAYGRGPNPLETALHAPWSGAVDMIPTPSPTQPVSSPTSSPTVPQPTPSQPRPSPTRSSCTVGTPTNVTANPGNGQVTVQWVAPPPTCAITGYTITGTPGNITVSAGAAARSVGVSNLNNGTPYSFVVGAIGSGGPGAGSAPSNQVTPAGPPGPPCCVVASPGDTTATLTWKAPANNGGAPITSYTVGPPSIGSVSVTVTAQGGYATLSNLVDGTSYTFTVAAVNSAGAGPSAASNAATPLCTGVSGLQLSTTPWHVYWQARGTCSPYSGTVVAKYTSLFGVVTYQTYPFSASGSNPSGAVAWSAPFGTSHTSFTVTLTDSRGISTSSGIVYN